MAKDMSFNSKSYSRVSGDFEEGSERFEKEVSYLPVRSYKEGKVTQMSYLQENSLGKQSVFRAEIVKTLTKSEIKKHLSNLKIALEESEPNQIFKISCHPQSDATTKSSHFHCWGTVTPAMEKTFEEYLKNNRLTVQEKANITAIGKGELRKVELNENNEEEIRKISYSKKTGHYVVGKDGIKSNNISESVVLQTLKIKENNNDSIDEEIEKNLKRANEKLKNIDENIQKTLETQEFKEFEKKFNNTFDELNENLEIFLEKRKSKIEELEERIKNSLKDIEV